MIESMLPTGWPMETAIGRRVLYACVMPIDCLMD
jgi:hypothetical protein